MDKTDNGVYYENKFFVCNVKTEKSIRSYFRSLLDRLTYPVTNLIYQILVYVIPQKEIKKKYNIAICSIFKNEGVFLREWIIYHRMLGVNHFYLYNNNSTDNYQEILNPFVEEGLVTLKNWPQIPAQIPAYQDWYENYREECQWVSFLDLDEFICPIYDYSITQWLDKRKRYPTIKMDWVMFGTSGNMVHNDKILCVEQYTSCWNKRCCIGKLFYNCNFDIKFFYVGMMHLLTTSWHGLSLPTFNDSGNICLDSQYEKISKKGFSIQCNHYYSRAYDKITEKVNRGSGAFKVNWKSTEKYDTMEMNNIKKDYTIWRFLVKLKKEYLEKSI